MKYLNKIEYSNMLKHVVYLNIIVNLIVQQK
jgi:hypothetical protein